MLSNYMSVFDDCSFDQCLLHVQGFKSQYVRLLKFGYSYRKYILRLSLWGLEYD